jgi:hypothetical protein
MVIQQGPWGSNDKKEHYYYDYSYTHTLYTHTLTLIHPQCIHPHTLTHTLIAGTPWILIGVGAFVPNQMESDVLGDYFRSKNGSIG